MDGQTGEMKYVRGFDGCGFRTECLYTPIVGGERSMIDGPGKGPDIESVQKELQSGSRNEGL